MWSVVERAPWVLPVCLAIVLAFIWALVRLILTRKRPDEEVTLWLLPLRFRVTGRARANPPVKRAQADGSDAAADLTPPP